jgi:hypothetical protein
VRTPPRRPEERRGIGVTTVGVLGGVSRVRFVGKALPGVMVVGVFGGALAMGGRENDIDDGVVGTEDESGEDEGRF